ncbi:MAG TPA: MotA/TolQ/ExbB proton channel family protein [Bacteroidales bacterium]|jgi:biopolymer transport protein ExbB/TolQ|nr:MotA/TolQ/ExbB proton channel family protein [Bacteroidales bacterium]
MEIISKALFWVANSLLIPDIILLLLFFGRSILLIGGVYNQFMIKRKTDKSLSERIKTLTPESLDTLREHIPSEVNSLFVVYLKDLLTSPSSEDYSDYLLSEFENKAEKDLSLPRMLSKIGPILGLLGTLIAMSPALVGLSTGDISGMAYNMQVVFATTVVGLVISAVGLVTLQLKQRWYAAELNKLDYVARILQQKKEIL